MLRAGPCANFQHRDFCRISKLKKFLVCALLGLQAMTFLQPSFVLEVHDEEVPKQERFDLSMSHCLFDVVIVDHALNQTYVLPLGGTDAQACHLASG